MTFTPNRKRGVDSSIPMYRLGYRHDFCSPLATVEKYETAKPSYVLTEI